MTDHEGAVRGLTEREATIYRLRVVNRLTEREIGERVGISQQAVSQILATIKDRLPKIDLEAVRQQSIALHEQVQRMALELAEMAGVPVTAGKDGSIVYDPETQGDDPENPRGIVRDYAGRVAALKLAQDADREIRKLLGADSATKIESTATVKYEIIGVDIDKLT